VRWRFILTFPIALIFAFSISAQTDLLDSNTDVDDLFGTTETADEEGNTEQEPENTETIAKDVVEVAEEETALVDIVRGSSVTLSGDFTFNIGYTAGYTSVPWIPGGIAGTSGTGSSSNSSSFSGFTQGALTDSKSAMSLNFRIAPIFRIYLTFNFSFPTFKTEIGEFFADYSFKDVVYLRAGRFTINWGISRYHPFTNLTARLPATYELHDSTEPIHDADSYGLRLSIPVGAGGFNLIGFTRNGFMEDPYYPAKDEIGYGGTYNLAIPIFDFTVGGFYIKQLNPRFFASLSSTLFNTVDAYAETVVSWKMENNEIRYGANAGFLYGFLDQQIQLSAEYYYNTETEELTVKGSEFPLIYGHNIAAGIAYSPKNMRLKTYARVNYNVNENSGLVIPGLSWSPLPYFTLTTVVPIIFGNPEGTYMTNQPVENEGRSASLVIMAILRAKF